MIIAVTSTGQIELRDANNFRAFSILDETGNSERLAAALSGLATVTPDGQAAWVRQDKVPHLMTPEATADWRSAYEAMIAAARKFGWVNGEDGTVRAHIETAKPAARGQ